MQEMKAIEGARKMMAERGYVVVGILASGRTYRPGDTTPFFGGALLGGASLRMDTLTDFEDYLAQAVALFGSTFQADKYEPADRGDFWRCSLVEVARA